MADHNILSQYLFYFSFFPLGVIVEKFLQSMLGFLTPETLLKGNLWKHFLFLKVSIFFKLTPGQFGMSLFNDVLFHGIIGHSRLI